MRKCIRRLAFLTVVVCCFYTGCWLADKQSLHNTVIDLHIVAASDSTADQTIKLQVRDAVLESLQQALQDATDVEQAKSYIQSHLPRIQEIANQVLKEMGSMDRAEVSFFEAAFPRKDYEAFSLPTGFYDALRITIGDREGKNRWCAVYPLLCGQWSRNAVEDTVVGAGFFDGRSGSAIDTGPCRLRFYFLELLGRVEKFFCGE